MSVWTLEYAKEQARLVLVDNGKLYSHGFVCDVLDPIMKELDRRETNPGVWDGAPDNATHAEVWFGNAELVSNSPDKIYTRELPKSRAREIAEEAWQKISHYTGETAAIDDIESAILKREAELKEAGK